MIQKSVKSFNSINPLVWVAVATALSFAFATYNLGFRSMWFDEVISVNTVKEDWTTFWTNILELEAYQRLYLLLLKLWITLGDNDTNVRFLSVIFSTASVPVIYLVGKELFDSRAGIFAAFFLGVNGFFIYYSQEARGYTLLLFLTLCSSYFAVRCVKSPTRKSWAGYTVFSVLAVYTHLFGVWILLNHAVSLFFLPRKMIDWKGISYSGLIIVISLLPILLFIAKTTVGQTDWIAKPTFKEIEQLLLAFAGWPGNIGEFVYLLIYVIPATLLARSCVQQGFSFNTWRYAFIVIWLYLPIILVYSASMVKPMFVFRYMIITLPGFILFAAVTLTRFDRKWISFLASAALIISAASFTINTYSGLKKSHWREAAKLVDHLSIDKDAFLFFIPQTRVPFEYYFNKVNKSSKTFHFTNSNMTYAEPEKSSPSELNEEWIKQLSKRHQRLWFVVSRSVGNSKLDYITTWLQKYYSKAHTWDFGSHAFVTLYLNKKKLKPPKQGENDFPKIG